MILYPNTRTFSRGRRRLDDLSGAEKSAIIELYASGERYRTIMKRFNISQDSLRGITASGGARERRYKDFLRVPGIQKPMPPRDKFFAVRKLPTEIMNVIADMRANKLTTLAISREVGLDWDTVDLAIELLKEEGKLC